jgi:hypothetical protein
MYWFKNKLFITGACLVLLAACKPGVKNNGPAYFNLKGYFTAEAKKLSARKTPITKSVTYNGQPEQKQVLIKNWARELSLFTESDVNKPAWRSSYKVTSNADSTVITAVDTNLRTRSITITQKAGKVKSIRVVNFTKNMLYQSAELLSYYPDSVYVIEKRQSVKVMGANSFRISGSLK